MDAGLSIDCDMTKNFQFNPFKLVYTKCDHRQSASQATFRIQQKKETFRTKKKYFLFMPFFCSICLLLIYDVKRIQREKNEDIVVRKKFISLFLSYTKAFLFSFFCLPFGYKKEKKYLYKNDIPMKRIHKKKVSKKEFLLLACLLG